MASTINMNCDNCTACANNTCTEVYHRQIRDEPEHPGLLGKIANTVEGAYEKVTGKVTAISYSPSGRRELQLCGLRTKTPRTSARRSSRRRSIALRS